MPPTKQTDNIIDAINQFACTFYQYLAQQTDTENFVFAPHSIATAFAMVYAGAKGNTALEMAKVFGFAEASPDFFAAWEPLTQTVTSDGTITTANAMFVHRDYSFLDDYMTLVQSTFAATPYSMDFNDIPAALKTINAWVDEQTRHRIPTILNKLESLTRLVLVNAVAFKGLWKYPFDPKFTRDAPFHNLDGTESTVPMMRLTEMFSTGRGNGWQGIRLPYAGERLSFVALLADDLASFEQRISGSWLWSITASLRGSEKVEVRLPRWTADSAVDLRIALDAMGVHDLFNPNAADLSGIDGTNLLYASDAQHKAQIEVNEAGTEASAATAVVITARSAPIMPTTVTFDRPFLYYLVDNATGVILFMGRMVKG